jgi:subtilisin
MARKPQKRSGSRTPDVTEDRASPAAEDSTRESQPDTTGPGTTGRFLVLLREDADAGAAMLSRVSGLRVASAADFEGGAAPEDLGGADALVLPQLGICVIVAQPDQIQALGASVEDTGVLAIEPERVVYAIQDGPALQPGLLGFAQGSGTQPVSLEYLRGYRDAVNHLYDKLTGTVAGEVAAEAAPVFAETELTWGLQATKVPASRFTGRGIRVAVLDTGLDLAHPDFTGRRITAQSFIEGQQVQDGHGHGTHCVGTACGPRRPGILPRYGVAYEAEIFAGKVLSNQGSGGDGGILAGIQWAITNGCAIVSMSLGAPVQAGQPFSQVFEQAARRALARGTLIIAAAGNESRRPQQIAPVGHPANCPSIMAVGAIDRRMQVAFFSCGGLNPQGGQVDLAGPGVDIRSSWPRPTLYNTINGTSMATPHVAGIAALWAESDQTFRARALMSMLIQSARRLPLMARDVGAGLVQAP